MRSRNLRTTAAAVVALCVLSAALGDARGATGPTAVTVMQTTHVTGNGAGRRETPPALRRARNRKLQKTESLISWLFESARGYWNFKQESKRDRKENEDNKYIKDKTD